MLQSIYRGTNIVRPVIESKSQAGGVEVESFCGVAAVEGVAEDGKAAAGKVDADLVGAAGEKIAF